MAARILKADIEQFLALHEERKELNRRAAALGKEADALEEIFAEHVREDGGKDRSLLTCGYVLSLADKPGQVQWKPAFVEVAGHDAAEALIQAAPTREVLSIQKAKGG